MRMNAESLWERLLSILNQVGTVVEVGPGRIQVMLGSPDGSPRHVEIVLTPHQWEEMIGIMWGNYCWEVREYVKDTVLGLQPDERFLVYAQYSLVPSATAELPADEEFTRLRELAREHPEGIGRWVVEDSDGTVIDELGWHPE